MLEKDATRCVDGEAENMGDLSDDKSFDVKKEIKVVDESSRSLSFYKRMKKLSPYRCSLKDRMKDIMVCYVDLL